MQASCKFQEPGPKDRISNASTQDCEFSSDDEFPFKGESIFTVADVSTLFDKISVALKDNYKELNTSLQVVYQKLDEEIEPVNVRDDLSVPAGSVFLTSVSLSKLSQRRSAHKLPYILL